MRDATSSGLPVLLSATSWRAFSFDRTMPCRSLAMRLASSTIGVSIEPLRRISPWFHENMKRSRANCIHSDIVRSHLFCRCHS